MEGPAPVVPDDLGGHQETGTGHMAVGAQQGTGEVEEAGLPQEPDGVSGGDPVVPEVLGVAVAGDGVVPLVKGPVHLSHKIGVHQVVGVKDEVTVVDVLTLLLQTVEEVIHRVALALLLLVEALIHKGAGLAGHTGGIVSAVVGHHIEVQQLFGIILLV